MTSAPLNIIKVMLDELTVINDNMAAFLVACGIELSEAPTLTEITEKVKELKVMLTTKKYAGLVFDENGYVIKTFPLFNFVDINKVPVDAAYGYYKFENNTFILDEERQRQIEEV